MIGELARRALPYVIFVLASILVPIFIVLAAWNVCFGSSGLEWKDGYGCGNYRVHRIFKDGQEALVYQLSDAWNTNRIYRMTIWHPKQARFRSGCAVSVKLEKRGVDGQMMCSGNFDMRFGSGDDKHSVVLADGFAPEVERETIELSITIKKTDEYSTANDDCLHIKSYLKSKKVFYFPSV